MISKTPQFDKEIKKVLKEFVPHERKCLWFGKHPHCEKDFNIGEEDIKFLKMFRVPAPNYCPTCRRMRRLVHLTVSRLFKNKCEAPGHNENIISIFPRECPFPVYDYKYYISDEFDPFIFGEDYNDKINPIEQLLNLRKKFPMPSFLNRNPSDVNSDYANGGRDVKNGYYAVGCYHAEDIWYTIHTNKSRNIMDSDAVNESDLVYKGISSDHLYNSSFVYFSSSCTDSMFLFDCRNCTDCFGCVNLRNAKYQVFNKQLKKEEYKDFMKSLKPFSRKVLEENHKKFWDLVKSLPMNGTRIIASNNVSGVKISNSKNLFDVTDTINSENVRHADGVLSNKDSMDFLYSGGNSSLLYMNTNIGSQSSKVKFSVSSKFCTDCEFVFNSKNLNNCFMCFGLQNKSYCILNKQYREEEYFKIIDDIKVEMLKRGEYQDGPGFEFSAQAYNFSLGQSLYPLTEDKIIDLGGYIAKEVETNIEGLDILTADQLPEIIDEVSDDILDKAIICEKTKRPFKLISSEIAFLKRMGLPLPTTHPSVRMEENWNFAPLARKYKTTCRKCNKEMESVFGPEREFNLYCEDCYKREVF